METTKKYKVSIETDNSSDTLSYFKTISEAKRAAVRYKHTRSVDYKQHENASVIVYDSSKQIEKYNQKLIY